MYLIGREAIGTSAHHNIALEQARDAVLDLDENPNLFKLRDALGAREALPRSRLRSDDLSQDPQHPQTLNHRSCQLMGFLEGNQKARVPQCCRH